MLDKAKNNLAVAHSYGRLLSLKYLPRWVIFAIDTALTLTAVFITYITLTLAGMKLPQNVGLTEKILIITGVHVFFMYLYKTYAGIIRHSAFVDLQRIFWAAMSSLGVLLLLNYIYLFSTGSRIFLNSVLIFNFVAHLSMLLLFRVVVKQSFHYLKMMQQLADKKRVLVLGISDIPVATAIAIIENPSLPYEVAGFLTARTGSASAKLLGKPIIEQKALQASIEKMNLHGVIVIREILSREELEEWVNVFLENGLKVYKAPAVEEIQRDMSNTSIRNLRIEDLLNRKPISIPNEGIRVRHEGKTVLVTGGAGSIGSELVRQVAKLNPALVVVVDQAETPLHDCQIEMQENFPELNFRFVLADVSNRRRMEQIFQEYQFAMVYHAAAYKHVPMIEENPHEGVRVNIWGTKNVAELSSRYGVNRFVMVSTDKAVNPTNVMGATKRAAELFVQSLQSLEGNTTKFITTRFGNVLGSNGSVIPHFQKQIEHGGPITLTHPDITRYFMTIPEACELVLQAGTMGHGGEIYVFDMGEPVKIIDLARRMIRLNGLQEGVDIEIRTTGLRPGEKLYEELLSDTSRTLPTHHEKIMIAKDAVQEFDYINSWVNKITVAAVKKDKVCVVAILKTIVPEFISNNSVFEGLDK